MKKQMLRITERVCELSTATNFRIVAIIIEEGKIITDDKKVHRLSGNNLKQLLRTGECQLFVADRCTITYNLINN